MPSYSMYAICAYINPSNHPNVGIYSIHGAFGYVNILGQNVPKLDLYNSKINLDMLAPLGLCRSLRTQEKITQGPIQGTCWSANISPGKKKPNVKVYGFLTLCPPDLSGVVGGETLNRCQVKLLLRL